MTARGMEAGGEEEGMGEGGRGEGVDPTREWGWGGFCLRMGGGATRGKVGKLTKNDWNRKLMIKETWFKVSG